MNQYGQPNPYPYPQGGVPDDNAAARMEVSQIDQVLSSGGYACYSCWLYTIAIIGCLGCLIGVFFTFHNLRFIVYDFQGLMTTFYAITMIDAMKNKRVKKADLGAMLAILFGVCLIVITIFTLVSVDVLIIGWINFLMYYLTILRPALLVKGLLEKREALMQKGSIDVCV